MANPIRRMLVRRRVRKLRTDIADVGKHVDEILADLRANPLPDAQTLADAGVNVRVRLDGEWVKVEPGGDYKNPRLP